MLRFRRAFLLLVAVAAAGCSTPAAEHDRQGDRTVAVIQKRQSDAPIAIVATTGMVADLVAHIGGKQVAVSQLMSAGVDPHLYKASTGDVIACEKADVIFYSGLHLEGKMADLFERYGAKKPVFAVTQYMSPETLLSEGNAYDPHVWFDVSLWRQAIGLIRDVLVAFDEGHADEYRRNAQAYDEELAALHEECKARLATIPSDRRVLVTAHDAFRYFGRAYSVEVHGIQGISTESEAGVSEVNRLIELLVSRKIKAIFVESSVSDQNVQSLRQGCLGKGHQVSVGGELFSDAMGAAGTPEGTYPGMVRHNVETIVKALQ